MSAYYLNNEVRPRADARLPGDVEVFASREEVEQYFEPWYVDETYFLLRSDGRRQVMVAEGARIRVQDADDSSNYDALLRSFLVYAVTNIGEAVVARRKLNPDIAKIDWSALPTETLFKIALLFR